MHTVVRHMAGALNVARFGNLICAGAHAIPHTRAPSHCIIIHTPREFAQVHTQCHTHAHPFHASYTPHLHLCWCARSATHARTLPMRYTHPTCICAGAHTVAHARCARTLPMYHTLTHVFSTHEPFAFPKFTHSTVLCVRTLPMPHTPTRTCTHTHCTRTRVHACSHTHTHIVHAHAHKCKHLLACARTHSSSHTHTHTHTHTHCLHLRMCKRVCTPSHSFALAGGPPWHSHTHTPCVYECAHTHTYPPTNTHTHTCTRAHTKIAHVRFESFRFAHQPCACARRGDQRKQSSWAAPCPTPCNEAARMTR